VRVAGGTAAGLWPSLSTEVGAAAPCGQAVAPSRVRQLCTCCVSQILIGIPVLFFLLYKFSVYVRTQPVCFFSADARHRRWLRAGLRYARRGAMPPPPPCVRAPGQTMNRRKEARDKAGARLARGPRGKGPSSRASDYEMAACVPLMRTLCSRGLLCYS
jgi:hypothetical protein